MLKILKSYLQDEGLQVSTFTNGHDAIKVMEDQKPDLIIVDICMPQLSGYELTQRLKSDSTFSAIPIIGISALGSKALDNVKQEVKMDDYLIKPFDIEKLHEVIQKYITKA